MPENNRLLAFIAAAVGSLVAQDCRFSLIRLAIGV
jgi:hypothetical protein